MRRQRWWLPLLALAFMTNWKSTLTLPVPDEELDTSTKLLGSSVVTSVSVVTGSSENETPVVTSTADRRRVIPSTELPGSPAGLLKPDRFQFFTLNKDGNVVTKQMTEKEIQGLIAAGGGHLPMQIHEPQTAGDVPVGGMKVADVVQNVQNVLKGELSKPTTVMTSVPTIPGHVNTEWSSILPSILGGESETAPVSETDIIDTPIVADTTPIKKPGSQTAPTKLPAKQPPAAPDHETKKKPTVIPEMDIHSEKPMIQVPVITVDQKLPAHQSDEDSMPVFQMLNTISADKVKSKNYTETVADSKPVEPPKIVSLGQLESAVRPDTVSAKPMLPETPAVEQSTPVEEKLPEMIEITFNSGNEEPVTKKPIIKPETPIKNPETISKSPESGSSATMSVVSETHSTSMKVSGQEEIPLREPAKPLHHMQITAETKPDEVKTTTDKITVEKLDSTSAKPGLLAQGVSFFGNLPETVSSIVADLISGEKPTVKPTAVDSGTKIPTKNSVNKYPGTTDSPKIPEITVSPTKETSTGSKREPVYQMIPEIIPNKKIPPHGASPSEASSIEHIIETLNDPTGSISGTVAADHFIVHTSAAGKLNDSKADAIPAVSGKPENLPDAKRPTSATPIGVENHVESSSVKPVDPLPTELADSLSSMISQVSDAIPSVLPVSQNANFDTTQKKNGVGIIAEEAVVTENIKTTELPVVSKTPEELENKIQPPVQAETEKPAVLETKVPEVEEPTIAIANVSTEKSKESPSTTDIPATTESSSLDSITTAKSVLPSTSNESTEVSVNKDEVPVAEKVQASDPKPENLKPEGDALQASSDITTDKMTPEIRPVESTEVENLTKSATTELVTIETTTTMKPANDVASSSTILSDHTERPTTVKTQSVSPIAQETPMLEDEKKTPAKNDSNENNTELPIVRIDITEAKPTGFKIANTSQGISANSANATESPLVRIQLMNNPVTAINNLIESASVDVSPPPLEPLILPESGSVPPNNIASGLIAGFPSTTTEATTENADTTTGISPIAVQSVKSEPEVQLVNDAPASNGVPDVANTTESVENITKTVTSETPAPEKESVTEKIEILEVSTSKDPSLSEVVVPAERIDPPKEPVAAESVENATTLQADSIVQASTEKSKKDEAPADATTTEVTKVETSTSPSEALNPSIKVAENVSEIVAEATTTETSTTKIGEDPEQRIQLPVSSTSGKPDLDDKANEASKIIETSVGTSVKPEVTEKQPESTETTIKDTTTPSPEKSVESNNSTKSETPVIRIEGALETSAAEIPSRIQLTDLPIVQTTASPKKPANDEGIQTFLTTEIAQSVTTMQSPVESTENNRKTSPNVSLQATALSSTEKTAAKFEDATKKPEKSDVVAAASKFEDATKNPEKSDVVAAASSDSSEKHLASQQTEEVRIQVNDTAVLVTKRPVSEAPVQKLGDVAKTPQSQEQSTTPRIPSINTVDPYAKLGEKVERLPVPVKLAESSINKAAAAESAIKKVVIGGLEVETRIRLGDEQVVKEVPAPTKLDDPRKPVTKNTDSPQSVGDKEASIVPTPNDDESANHEKDSIAETSTKVKITTPASSETTSAPMITALPLKSEEKQPSGEKEAPIGVTIRPTARPGKPAHKPTMNIKKDDAIPKPGDDKWTLIPQQVYPALTKTSGSHVKRPTTTTTTTSTTTTTEAPSTTVGQTDLKILSTERPSVPLDHHQSASGLDSTVRNLETDISYFANLCNELAFSFWTATNKGLSSARSLAVSPFGMTSMLAMVFLGARGPTSDQMNDILRLDDVASFNPHLVFQNVTDAVGLARNQGIANAAFVRELFADRSKVRKLMPFYKDQAQQFYDGIVAEVNFATISDLVRRRTNLMIRKQTGGRIKDFVRTNTVPLRSPLAALSANVFQTDCNSSAASSEGRDGELYFAVSPAVRQRKLVPVPATVWRAGVLAGYEPSVDATAVALGGTDKLVSTIFVMPGQQGHTAPGDTLDRLEQRVVRGAAHEGAWNKLLKVLIPRPGLELQVPKFSHRSVINATAALKRMGLEELFSKHADLKGINGVATDLHLADVLQMNLFSTCGDENIMSGRHHVEVYPGSPSRNARDYRESEDETDESPDDLDKELEIPSSSTTSYESVPHREARSPRQINGPEKPRLKLDRPFLYFVRHNPTGLILHMGRFNPRLLP